MTVRSVMPSARGDLLVAEPAGELLEHVALARREGGVAAAPAASPRTRRSTADAATGASSDPPAATDAHRREELGARRALEQVPRRARLDRAR